MHVSKVHQFQENFPLRLEKGEQYVEIATQVWLFHNLYSIFLAFWGENRLFRLPKSKDSNLPSSSILFLYNVIKHEAASYGKAIYFWFWYNSLYCRNIVIFLISVFFQIKLDLLKNPNSSLALRFNQEYFFQRYPHKWQHSTMNQPGIF